MIDILKQFFKKTDRDNTRSNHPASEHDIRIATCALFVEMARIDEQFSQKEMESILEILKKKYGLSKKHANALMAETKRVLAESVDLWQFTRLINENYTPDEKIEIVETLWGMVYADGNMDRHEHYLMSKMKNLLRLSHGQVIDAKLRVLKSNDLR